MPKKEKKKELEKTSLTFKKGKEYTLDEIVGKIARNDENKIIFNISQYTEDYGGEPYEHDPEIKLMVIADTVNDAIKIFKEIRNKSPFKIFKKEMGGAKVILEDAFFQATAFYECIKVEENKIIYKSDSNIPRSSRDQLLIEIHNLKKRDIKKMLKEMKFFIKLKDNTYTKKIYELAIIFQSDPVQFFIEYLCLKPKKKVLKEKYWY